MGNVLFAWELGGGLSHVAEMLPLIEGLRARGHRVCTVIRDFSRVARLFAEAGAECLAAPAVPPSAPCAIGPSGSFSYVLGEAGFADPNGLQNLTELCVFTQVKEPDVLSSGFCVEAITLGVLMQNKKPR